jgi:hypothetical protein
MLFVPFMRHNEGNGAFQNQPALLQGVRDAKYRTRRIGWPRPA